VLTFTPRCPELKDCTWDTSPSHRPATPSASTSKLSPPPGFPAAPSTPLPPSNPPPGSPHTPPLLSISHPPIVTLHVPPSPETPVSNDRGKKRKVDNLNQVPDSLPPWARNMEAYLRSGVSGVLWSDAVSALVVMEWKAGFTKGTKSLPTTHRPEVIASWIKYGREPLLPQLIQFDYSAPDFENRLQGYIDSVVFWWNALQPEWRKIEGTVDDLAHECWEREVKGEWGNLRCYGVNGFWSVFALLKWWLMLEQKAEKNSSGFGDVDCNLSSTYWAQIVEDVVWVVNSIAEDELDKDAKKRRLEAPSTPSTSSSSKRKAAALPPTTPTSSRVLRPKPASMKK
jgi:hypothetical protein